MKISNPHDTFFKETFSNKEFALDFIQGVFPETLKKHLDLSTLTLDPNSYVDESLQESFSDIVYNCLYKSKIPLKISILFEHKSFPSKYPHFQLLKYMLGIWEINIKQKKALEPIVPIVVYHGEKTWYYVDMGQYFGSLDETLRVFLPDFRYLLTDFSNYSDEALKTKVFQHAGVIIACLIMKNIFDQEKLQRHFRDFLEIGRIYFQEERGLKFLESVIRYIFQSTKISVAQMVEQAEQISNKGGEIAMTTAQTLREEGKKLGLKAGIKKGEKAGIKKGEKAGIKKGEKAGIKKAIFSMMNVKFGSIPKTLENRIKKLSEEELLTSLLTVCIKAESIEEMSSFIKKIGKSV